MTPRTTVPALHDASVYVGRFQVFHNGQLALLRRALSVGRTCVVVLGSAFQARTPRNPFTWQERAEMIGLALTPDERAKLRFLPVRDYYDSERWVAAVKEGVTREAKLQQGASVVLVGHFKDATSDYLRDFPGWTLDAVDSQGQIHSSTLRDAYFSAAPGAILGAVPAAMEATLAALVSQAPVTTLDFLRAWSALPYFSDIAHESAALRKEKALWAGSPYPPVFVTVDAIVRCAGRVLLIRRGRAPGKGLYAVPGGFLEQRETVYQSALRELTEETGIRLLDGDMKNALKDVKVFDHPDRSQRGRVITHAHYFDLGARRPPEVQAADDAASADWVPIEELAGLEDQFHDDHFHILDLFFGLTN